MRRLGIALGIASGLMLVLSSAAHSLLGWKQLSADLAKTNAPPDLVRGLAIGWHFGGLAMLIFGILVLGLFAMALRGNAIPVVPAFVISIGYLAFGIGALAVTGFDPFFMVFIVPGLLLLVGALLVRKS